MRLVVSSERGAGVPAKLCPPALCASCLLTSHGEVQHQWGTETYTSRGSGERTVDIG